MESRQRRRRRSHRPLVSAFLRDPGSGRVYRRGKLIGKGAFSRCYKLTDMSTNSVFALKVVPRGGVGPGRLHLRGKVEREIALHSRLRHRNIVAFHGHFADRDHVYMVLEYCSRQSLAHVLEARHTLTEPEVRYYLRGLVSGLDYLHQRRIVHRDLKLSNFFLNKNMEVKIGDLGLAARVGPGGRCHRVLCGTPNFQAPEVVTRNGHSCQSDIWALGCVMYMVLTGAPPFMAAPLSEMYQNIRAGRYPEPTHVSPNARRLIARLLAPDPAARPSLDLLLQDDFFTQGFTPDRLPPHSCHSPPIFAVPPPLGRLFRKVGQLMLSQCGSPCPGEDGGDPDSVDLGGKATLMETEASVPKCPVPLFSQGTLRSDPSEPDGSSRGEVEAAIRSLRLCLDPGPPGVGTCLVTQDPAEAHQRILWAPKWVDYSRKYGFGYQLSDGGSGVLFRDGTHMAVRPPEGQVSYMPARGSVYTWALRDVPGPLGAKLAVLQLFASYLRRRKRRRLEGGAPTGPAPPAGPSLCLLRFLASPRALLLLFSDNTVQVSFTAKRAHLLLSGRGEGLRLSVWEGGQPGLSYPLGVLQSRGCTPAARRRLLRALHLLQSI